MGRQLESRSDASNSIQYTYNENGIIGLVDTNGNWVVEYLYDAWGMLLGTSGTLANTLGQTNDYIEFNVSGPFML